MSRLEARTGMALGCAAAALLTACQPSASSSVGAPARSGPAAAQDGCYEVTPGGGSAPTLRPVEYQVPNLETCAVQIEGLRLEKGRDITGLWNGVWIFASAREVTSATAQNAARYAIFQPDQKAQIDQSLTQQIEQERAGKGGSSRPANGAP